MKTINAKMDLSLNLEIEIPDDLTGTAQALISADGKVFIESDKDKFGAKLGLPADYTNAFSTNISRIIFSAIRSVLHAEEGEYWNRLNNKPLEIDEDIDDNGSTPQ